MQTCSRRRAGAARVQRHPIAKDLLQSVCSEVSSRSRAMATSVAIEGPAGRSSGGSGCGGACQPACKPGSVWRVAPPRRSFIWDAVCTAPRATNPGDWAGDALITTALRPPYRVTPIWSCSRWGLQCRCRRRLRGALLPHPFTLTAQDVCPGGGLLSVALSLGSPPAAVNRHRISTEPGLSSPGCPAATVRPADTGGDKGSRPSGVKRHAMARHRTVRPARAAAPSGVRKSGSGDVPVCSFPRLRRLWRPSPPKCRYNHVLMVAGGVRLPRHRVGQCFYSASDGSQRGCSALRYTPRRVSRCRSAAGMPLRRHDAP